MKRFNKNIIVFIVISIIILLGFSKGSILNLGSSIKHLITDPISNNTINSFKNKIDVATSELLNYHDYIMDINSIKDNLLNTRIVEKDDVTVVKTYSDRLIDASEQKHNNAELSIIVNKFQKLQKQSEKNGAEFLYIAVPAKEYYETPPENVKLNNKTNLNNFINLMNNKKIPTLNFVDVFSQNKTFKNDIYFKTDHHWKPYTAFVATGNICEELNKLYGFEYNKKFLDIKNYNIHTYKDYFLGSWGKKVGTYFTWGGVDDIDIITPKFKTSFIENKPFENQVSKGSFSDVLIYKNELGKNYYNNNPYSAYCGGNWNLQIIKNNYNLKGKKILLIRDSFACVVAPYLALQTHELHLIDPRGIYSSNGKKVNIFKYIKKIKPDYVLALYSDIKDSENRLYGF